MPLVNSRRSAPGIYKWQPDPFRVSGRAPAASRVLPRGVLARMVGYAKRPGYSLSLIHIYIRREKATSNICTAQVLLAVMASMYAVYHGPDGLKRIARRVNALTGKFAAGLRGLEFELDPGPVFDTVTVRGIDARRIHAIAEEKQINLRWVDSASVGVSLDAVSYTHLRVLALAIKPDFVGG